ncbi:myosin-4-like isoform X1 [Senna tora]|uniref:Myosin-4-like isoform X1 n=1 Tax=Senna tora TaxID=362788 RepID=A0A834W6F5_9FABA|nr:myosin-4-like isoform X1 [Senna tora]
MNVNPKTEPSSAPASDSSDVNDVDTTPMTLRIPDLIFQLRFAIRTKQFDDVERLLVAREAQLKREVEKLREISDFESFHFPKREQVTTTVPQNRSRFEVPEATTTIQETT